jgi:hypothetical protein
MTKSIPPPESLLAALPIELSHGLFAEAFTISLADILAVLGTGSVVGELPMIDRAPRSTSVAALPRRPCRVGRHCAGECQPGSSLSFAGEPPGGLLLPGEQGCLQTRITALRPALRPGLT